MSGTLLSSSVWKYFAGKKCVYASMRMSLLAPSIFLFGYSEMMQLTSACLRALATASRARASAGAS